MRYWEIPRQIQPQPLLNNSLGFCCCADPPPPHVDVGLCQACSSRPTSPFTFNVGKSDWAGYGTCGLVDVGALWTADGSNGVCGINAAICEDEGTPPLTRYVNVGLYVMFYCETGAGYCSWDAGGAWPWRTRWEVSIVTGWPSGWPTSCGGWSANSSWVKYENQNASDEYGDESCWSKHVGGGYGPMTLTKCWTNTPTTYYLLDTPSTITLSVG